MKPPLPPQPGPDTNLLATASDFKQVFDLAPVSLWVEDFSAIRVLMDDVRECGTQDVATFMRVHPDFVTRCTSTCSLTSCPATRRAGHRR